MLLPAKDVLQQRKVRRCREFLERTQWLKQEEIELLQLTRLRRIVHHAHQTVPYYREVLRRNNVYPDDIRKISHLHKIPVLTRDLLRTKNRELVSLSRHSKVASIHQTGGTTAKPVRFLRGESDASWGWAAALRAYRWAGYELGDKEALIWARPSMEHHALGPLYDKAKRTLLVDISHFSTEHMDEILAELERFSPHFLRGYARRGIYHLAQEFLDRGRVLRVRAVIPTASLITHEQRKVIREAFRCPVFDFYGAREVMSIGAECEEHKGLHISAENTIVEVLRDGEQASPGKVGSLVITNLTNYAMPLLRYEIGDLGRIGDSSCPCGRGLPLLDSLEGRKYEYIVNSDGTYTYLRDLDTFFGDLPVRDFQVVLREPDLITVRVVPGQAYTRHHDALIQSNIKWSGRSKVSIERVDGISPSPSGKKLTFVRHSENSGRANGGSSSSH